MEKQLLYTETQGALPKINSLTIKKYFQIINCLREHRSVHFEMIVKII